MTEYERLRAVIARLRAEDGCPWDRAQTHASLKRYCIEEAAEVLCGVNILEETGNPANLREELGDLMLEILLQAQIAEEEGLFTAEDVAREEADKMIRRHPHVFAPDDPLRRDGSAAKGSASGAAPKEERAQKDAAMAALKVSVQEDPMAAWEAIKKSEKEGREWETPYLAAAMNEAGELLETAKKRKGFS